MYVYVIVGMYTTLDIEDLVEVNQAELLRKQWHPGRRIFEALQRRFAVPQAYSQSVHVLTNEPVFRGNNSLATGSVHTWTFEIQDFKAI